MGQSSFTGPLISLGGFAGGPNGGPPAEYSVEIGPSMFWQGMGLLAMDGRGSKDKKGMGSFPALYMSTSIMALSQVIQPAGVALTNLANASSGVPLPNVTAYAAGRAPGTPVQGGALGVGIETGFSIVAVTSGNPTIVVNAADKWRFSPGMFLSIAGGGLGGSMLFTKVTAISAPGVNSITVSPPPQNSTPAAQIGTYGGDPSRYGFVLPTHYSPFMNGGAGRFLLPDNACTRGVGVTGAVGGSGGAVLIQGLDYLGRAQSEIINAIAGAGTTYGLKTYKIFLSATPQFTNATNYQVITSDLIGMPISLVGDEPSPIITEAGVPYAGAAVQYADLTNPATTSTGDPRGGIQLSPAGPNAAATGAGPDGVSRIGIVLTLNPAQVLSANQFNPGPLFGVAPV
jgi:hypothetical protein